MPKPITPIGHQPILDSGLRNETTTPLPMTGVFTLAQNGGLRRAPIDMFDTSTSSPRPLRVIPPPPLEGGPDDFVLQEVCGTTLIPRVKGSRSYRFAYGPIVPRE